MNRVRIKKIKKINNFPYFLSIFFIVCSKYISLIIFFTILTSHINRIFLLFNYDYYSNHILPYIFSIYFYSHGREEAQARVAYSSRCIYIGNLAFVTTDVQLYTLFSQCGSIERVIMGINRHTKQPAGFAYIM